MDPHQTWSYYITCTDHSGHTLADAVKSDVVHLVTAHWAFLLPLYGAEQVVHAEWPTGIFAHSCIRGQTYINSPLWTSPPAAIIDSCHVLRQSKALCFVQPIMVCGSFSKSMVFCFMHPVLVSRCRFSRNKAQIAATSFSSPKYSAFMHLIIVR